jgi:hypothetical protein
MPSELESNNIDTRPAYLIIWPEFKKNLSVNFEIHEPEQKCQNHFRTQCVGFSVAEPNFTQDESEIQTF